MYREPANAGARNPNHPWIISLHTSVGKVSALDAMARVTIVHVFAVTRGRHRAMGVTGGRRAPSVRCACGRVDARDRAPARPLSPHPRCWRLSLDRLSHAGSNEARLDSECRIGDGY